MNVTRPYLMTFCTQCKQVHEFKFIKSRASDDVVFHEYECPTTGKKLGVFYLITNEKITKSVSIKV